MTLLQFEIFLKLAELKSFTKTGEALGLTQSAVSHAIKGLETELELPILRRGKSGISLTGEGEIILRNTRRVLDAHEQLKQEAAALRGIELGSIRIATFASFSVKILPGILKSFQSTYPNIEIDFLEGGYEEIKKWLADGRVDIGFLTLPSDRALETVPLIKDDFIAVIPEGYSLPKYDLEYLAREPLIMPKDGCEILVKNIFKEKKINPNIRYEIKDNATIFSMVQQGLGLSIVPSLAMYHDLKGIKVLPFDEEAYRIVGLGMRSSYQPSPAVKAFIEVAKSWLLSEGYKPPQRYSKYCR